MNFQSVLELRQGLMWPHHHRWLGVRLPFSPASVTHPMGHFTLRLSLATSLADPPRRTLASPPHLRVLSGPHRTNPETSH